MVSDDDQFKQLVYEQVSDLTVALSTLIRTVAAIHLGNQQDATRLLNEAIKDMSDAFERLDALSGMLK